MKKAAALSLLLAALAAAMFLSPAPLCVRSAWVGSNDDGAGAASSVLKNVQDATKDAYQSASDYAGRTGDGIRQAGANVADRVASMVGGVQQQQPDCDDVGTEQRSLLDRAADAVSWRSKEEAEKDGAGLGGASAEEASSWQRAKEKLQEARHAASEAAGHVKEALFHRSTKGAQQVQEASGSYAGQAAEAGKRAREGAQSTYSAAQDRAGSAKDTLGSTAQWTYSAAQDRAGSAKDTLGSTVGRAMETLASAKDAAGEKLQEGAQATYSTLQDTAGKAKDTVGSTFSSAQEAAGRGARSAYDVGARSAGSAYETVGGAYSTASDVGSSAYQAAREKAGAAFDAASDKAGSAYDAMFMAIEMLTESLKSVPGRTAEYAGSASDRLGSATQPARDAGTGAYERAAGAAGPDLHGIVEKVPDAAQVKNASAEAAETAGAAGGHVKEKVGETAGAAGGRVKEKVGETADAAGRHVKEKVGETAGAAGGYIKEKVAGGPKDEENGTAGLRGRPVSENSKQPERGHKGASKKNLIPSEDSEENEEFYAWIRDEQVSGGPKDEEHGTAGLRRRPVSENSKKPERGHEGASKKNLIPSDDSEETEEFYAWIRDEQARERQCDCRCEKEHAPGSARDVAGVVGGKISDVGHKLKDKTVGGGGSEDGGAEATPMSGPQGAGYMDCVGPVAAAASSAGRSGKSEGKSPLGKGGRTEEVGQAPPSGGLFTSLARLLHLASFAFSFGTTVWMTFLSGQVLSKVVSRQQFGQVQSRLFPAYLKSAAVGQVLTFLIHWMRHPWSSSDASERLQFANLCFSLAANITNIFYLEPQVSRVMFERLKLEKEEGGEDGRMAANGATKTRVAELARHFNVLHGYSSLVNLLSLVGQTWHLWYLSRRLVI